MRCKTLTAIYKNEINTLKKLYEIDFLIHKSVRIHIEQFTVRKIEIDFTSEQLVDDLIAVLTKVERLLMLFDGYFMNLISIEFQDSAGCVPPNLKECAEHFMRRRLAYFHSNKILFSSNYLLDFSKVLTPALYEKWKGILEDLDVAHQVYLYSLCDTNQPVDLRCAFLIELAEPVVEIAKANSPLFESLNPGKQGTSLRDCLRALITTYGSDIFENEINSCFETFLKSLHVESDRTRATSIYYRSPGILRLGCCLYDRTNPKGKGTVAGFTGKSSRKDSSSCTKRSIVQSIMAGLN